METLARRGFASQSAYFHGTSSKFLRSIMINGLDPNLAKTGRWVEQDNGANLNQRSRQSYGGIYFAGNLMTSLIAAQNSVEKLGGNRLIICALLTDKSAVPDEDNYSGVDQALMNALGGSNNEAHLINAWMQIRMKANGWWGSWTDYFDKFNENVNRRFKINYSVRNDANILRKVIHNLLIAGLQRKVAYLYHTNDNFYKAQFNRSVYDILRDRVSKFQVQHPDGTTSLNIPKKWLPALPIRSEQLYRRTLNQFILMTKDFLFNDDSNFDKSLRLLTPIKFRGRNKITGIIEILPPQSSKQNPLGTRKTYIRIHYGKIPPEFFAEWKQRKGSLDDLVILNKHEVVETVAFQGDLNGPVIGERPNEWVIDDLFNDDSTSTKQDKPKQEKSKPSNLPKLKKEAEETTEPGAETEENSEEPADTQDSTEKPQKKKILTDKVRKSVKSKKTATTEEEPDAESVPEDDNASKEEGSGKKLLTPKLKQLLKVR